MTSVMPMAVVAQASEAELRIGFEGAGEMVTATTSVEAVAGRFEGRVEIAIERRGASGSTSANQASEVSLERGETVIASVFSTNVPDGHRLVITAKLIQEGGVLSEVRAEYP